MTTEEGPEPDVMFSLRVKRNGLLFVTGLVVGYARNILQYGHAPWSNGAVQFLSEWLIHYVAVVLVVLLCGAICAATDNFFFGKRDPRTQKERTHEVIVYVCIALVVSSLFALLVRYWPGGGGYDY